MIVATTPRGRWREYFKLKSTRLVYLSYTNNSTVHRLRCIHDTEEQLSRDDESKVLDGEPASDVLELLHGERAVVRSVARLAGEETSATVLALVARDREVDLALREVDDTHGEPATGALALDVVDVVHVDELAVAACERS